MPQGRQDKKSIVIKGFFKKQLRNTRTSNRNIFNKLYII